MHRLHAFQAGADLDDDDLRALYDAGDRPAPHGRPWVLVNMVASLDGATAVDGRSGALGGDGDRRVFSILRTVPDVVVVAAGTARAENYGPPSLDDAARDRRRARGQQPDPVLAVITRSLDLDPESRLFADGHRPLVITVADAPEDRRAALGEVADLVTAGRGDVDLDAALAALAARGHTIALLEGGPTLNGQFVAADRVDELCLTVAPALVAGASKRVAVGPVTDPPLGLSMVHVLEHENTLLLRYRRP